jgi:hypothetical protein
LPTASVILQTGLQGLVPQPTDRACLVGQTGSGKTTLARFLLQYRPFVVVHDGKGTIEWPGYRRFVHLKAMVATVDANPRNYPRVIYRPTVEEMRNPALVDGFFRWVYLRKNCTLYVDETFSVVEAFQGVTPPGYQACITRGREKRVEVWSSTQRPYRIPLIVLTESEHYYVFRLQGLEDRLRMRGVSGLSEEAIAGLSKRLFYHVSMDGHQGPLTLKINKEGTSNDLNPG